MNLSYGCKRTSSAPTASNSVKSSSLTSCPVLSATFGLALPYITVESTNLMLLKRNRWLYLEPHRVAMHGDGLSPCHRHLVRMRVYYGVLEY